MQKREVFLRLRAVKPNESAFKILIYLSMSQFPVRLKEIVSALKMKRPTVKKGLAKLKESRLIFSPQYGYYASTITFVDLISNLFAIYELRLGKLEGRR